MTYSLLRITAVSLSALSLTACMSGSNSPWTPEFGQAQAPHNQQSTYGQSQYQYAQYPMPGAQAVGAQTTGQDEMVNDYLATLGLAGSQYLSPLPNTYPPQTSTHTQASQGSTWNGQQQYNSQYAPTSTTQSYQQPAQRQNTQSYQPSTQQSYQSPYTPSTPSMSAPTRTQAATTPYTNSQSRTYGQTTKTPTVTTQSSYGRTMAAPMTSQGSSYGQTMSAPKSYQQNSYGQAMKAPMSYQQNSYGQSMRAPTGQASMGQRHMMQAQAPQSNMISWGQAMAWMYQGQVKSAMQSHKGTVTMVLHNGQTAETQSPQIDDVLRLKQDCGAVCQNMVVATE